MENKRQSIHSRKKSDSF